MIGGGILMMLKSLMDYVDYNKKGEMMNSNALKNSGGGGIK